MAWARTAVPVSSVTSHRGAGWTRSASSAWWVVPAVATGARNDELGQALSEQLRVAAAFGELVRAIGADGPNVTDCHRVPDRPAVAGRAPDQQAGDRRWRCR